MHGPQLIVELAGTPPTPEAAEQRALALYSSAALPPVKSPYAIVWYGASDKELWSRFTVSNNTTYASAPEWLAQRGVLDMTWGEGGPIDWLPTEEAWEKYYLGVAETSTPQYVRDIRGESAGSHFITVHATDGNWNRAAAQNLVRCE